MKLENNPYSLIIQTSMNLTRTLLLSGGKKNSVDGAKLYLDLLREQIEVLDKLSEEDFDDCVESGMKSANMNKDTLSNHLCDLSRRFPTIQQHEVAVNGKEFEAKFWGTRSSEYARHRALDRIIKNHSEELEILYSAYITGADKVAILARRLIGDLVDKYNLTSSDLAYIVSKISHNKIIQEVKSYEF